MNREILFRGKKIVNGEWVEGDLFKHSEQRFIAGNNRNTEVISSTVGQYTGLTDRNGVKIFDGDIVTGTAYSFERVGVIVWIDEIAGFGIKYRKREEPAAWENTSILKQLSKGRNDQFAAAVIGNIYDTPELLKGEENNV